MTKTSTTTNNSGASAINRVSIVFFGSGPVAAESFRLLSGSFDIEAVVTKPRPPHHKGSVPVIELAEQLNTPIILATNKRELSAEIAKQNFNSQAAVLIDFGIIVTQDVIDSFPLGIVNSHFSLLPELRGADPITFSILSGQKQTGVSLMLLVEAMDEGPIIACGVQQLDGSETTPWLTESLIKLSYALLKDELPRYLSGEAKTVDQQALSGVIDGHPSQPSYSRKLAKQDSVLDFSKPADQLEREIRAFSEWPKSRTKLGNIDVVINSAHVVEESGRIGSMAATKEELILHCSDKSLSIDEITPAGKKTMPIKAFLAGYRSILPV